MRDDCAGRELLKRFLEEELSPSASEVVSAHVEGCLACQRLLHQLAVEEPDLPPIAAGRDWDDPDEDPAPAFLDRLSRTLAQTNPLPDVVRGRRRVDMGCGHTGEPTTMGSHDRIAPTPTTLPGYEILGELSRGGMGVVYKARQVGLNRLVALKMILAGDRAGTLDRARFRAEAEAVARLHHPNIVQIYDIGEIDGSPYFSMELVEGPTLAQVCEGRPQSPPSAAKLVETVARAIHCAHQRGILHRDLKPANVLLQSAGAGNGRAGLETALAPGGDSFSLSASCWTPKVADFGLAKRLDDVSLTQHGLIVGTPSYMAPEQVTGKGQSLSIATDVYGLGTILYELLTGRAPFVAGSIESTLAIVASEDPIPPRRLRPGVPRDLETICLKCLEKDPSRRYSSAELLADDLRRFANGEPVLARAPGALDRSIKLARRHPAAVVGILGVISALTLGLAATMAMAVRESRARLLADRSALRATASARAALGQAYQARMAAAVAAMERHDITEAARQLEAAPQALRGWEWRHVRTRLDQSLAVVTGLPNIETAAFCPPGKRIAVPDGRHYRIVDAESGKLFALRPTERPCRRVLAFTTQQGLRMLVDDRSTDAPFLSLTDGKGATCGRLRLPLDRDHPDEMDIPLRAAMSRDGSRIACQAGALGSAPSIDVFETSSGRRIASFRGPGAIFQALDWSPAGTRIVAAMESTQMLVFDVDARTRVTTLSGHSGAVRGVACSPDGRRLASCGDDQTIRVWDARTYETLAILVGHAGSVLCLAASPDGKWLVSGGSDGTVRIWGIEGGSAQLVLHGHTAPVTRVAFSDDGRTIASTSWDGSARLWDASVLADPCVLRGHRSYVYPVAYCPSGRWIASGAWDGIVRLWDAASGRLAHTLDGHTGPVGALAFTPDGTKLASWAEDRTIRIWDTFTGGTIACLAHESMSHRDSVYSLLISPDGKRLGAVTHDGLRFWDLATYAELPKLQLPLGGVRVAAQSPGGDLLAVAGDDPKVVIARADSGLVIAELTGFTGRIQSLAFSPDGCRLLTTGRDRALRLWDVATGVMLRTYSGHSQEVLSAVFHPDGSRIASGGHDRSILIWDTATGDELVRLPGHSWYVFSLAFSPDGETLISGSGDATVRLWDAFPPARRLEARREPRR
jgi:eukaryotic-like serine/threonine-protein kinase